MWIFNLITNGYKSVSNFLSKKPAPAPVKVKKTRSAGKPKMIRELDMSFVDVKRKTKRSKGEQIVKEYLDKCNVIYDEEFMFEDCIYKRKLRFDFYLVEYDACIEFDGRQHFQVVEYYGGEKTFAETQIRDKIKTEYCEKNKIPLLRLRYDDHNVDYLVGKFLEKLT